MSSYLPLSWSDRCLEPPYIWVRCGKREPRPGSGKGSCFWRLVLSVSGGKGTTEGKISVLTAFLCLYSKLLLSQTLVWLSFSNTNWIKPQCVWQHELRWEVPFFGLKKNKKPSCHKVMTSSGSGNQHGLAELVSHDTVRSNQILLAHAISCLTAVRSYVVRGGERW